MHPIRVDFFLNFFSLVSADALDDVNERIATLHKALPENPMLTENVGEEEIGIVVSRWTGIPLSRLTQTEVHRPVCTPQRQGDGSGKYD